MDDRTAPMPSQARPVSVAGTVEPTVNREPTPDPPAREGSAVYVAPERPKSGSFDDDVERQRAPPARPAVGYTATFAAPVPAAPHAGNATLEGPRAVPSAPAPVDVFASRASFAGGDAGADAQAPTVLAPPQGVEAVASPQRAPAPTTDPQFELVVTAPMALPALTALRARAMPTEPQGAPVGPPITEEVPPAQPRSTDPWMPAVVLPTAQMQATAEAAEPPEPTVAVERAGDEGEDGHTLGEARGAATLELPAQAAPTPLEPPTLPLTELLTAAEPEPVAPLEPTTVGELAAAPAVTPDEPTVRRRSPPAAPRRSRAPLLITAAVVACAAIGAICAIALFVLVDDDEPVTPSAPPTAAAPPPPAPAPLPTPPPVAPSPGPPVVAAALPPSAANATPPPPPLDEPAPPAPPDPPALAPPPPAPPVAALPPPPPALEPVAVKAAPAAAPVRAADGFGPFLDRSGGAGGLGRALGAGVRAVIGEALAGTAVGVRGDVVRARLKDGRATAECVLVVFDAQRARVTVRGSASVGAAGPAAAALPRAAEACAHAVDGEIKAAVALAKGTSVTAERTAP